MIDKEPVTRCTLEPAPSMTSTFIAISKASISVQRRLAGVGLAKILSRIAPMPIPQSNLVLAIVPDPFDAKLRQKNRPPPKGRRPFKP